MLKFCSKCRENELDAPFQGYYPFLYDDDYECPDCKSKLVDTGLDETEYLTIADISMDVNFLDAMIKLKQDDIVEYELKMSHFRNQVEQQKQNNNSSNDSKPKCPTCGSTNIEKISLTKKAFGGAMFGLFSSDIRNTMHCKNCGAKW